MFDPSRDPSASPEVVLGIDPGLSRCGYGAVRREGHRMVPVAFGVLRTPPEAPLPSASLSASNRSRSARLTACSSGPFRRQFGAAPTQ